MQKKKFFYGLLICVCFLMGGVVAAEDSLEELEEEYLNMFLSRTSILLRPGEKALRFSLSYQNKEDDFLVIHHIDREFSFESMLSIGVLDNVEAYVNVPLRLRRVNEWIYDESENGREASESKFGFGDTQLGMRFVIRREGEIVPNIIGAIGMLIPLSDDSSTSISLDSDGWGISSGLSFVKSCDPVVIFGGASYTRLFREGAKQSKWILGYNLGIGFAVNDKVTLSEQILGAYRPKSNRGISTESVVLQTGATYALTKSIAVEPLIHFGLSDAAADFGLELVFSVRF